MAGDGSIQLWDVATRQPRARLALPERWEVSWVGLRWSPDAQYLATHSGFGTWHVWDVAQAQLLDKTSGAVWQAISPDWRFAFGPRAGLVDLRDPRRPRSLQTVSADPMAGPAEFGPNGQRLAVALGDNSVQFWSSATGQRAGPPMKTAARVTWMQFSTDGRVLVTAESGEREPGASALVRANIRLWDATTALPCGRPIPATALYLFTSAHLSPDNRYLLLPTLKVLPSTRDRPIPVLLVWPLPISDVTLEEMQRRTESTTGMRLDAAGNVVAVEVATSDGK